MSIFGDIAQAIQDTAFFTAIRESGLAYPVIMSTHLSSIGVFGGMILMTDLRILGLAMKDVTVTDMVRQLRPWKYLGFIVMVSMGIMLGGAKLAQYYDNPYFQLKMTLLFLVFVHAMAFRRSVYRNTEALDRAPEMPRVAKTAAILSLCLWLGILSCGRWIAYFERSEEHRPVPASATVPNIP
ncbi:MAG TPA: DUF6644 family protein [Bryobacteraceae bacterium]|nr:DUF6644 family protein [Bryobacteraceae bacterium]